MSMIGEKIFPNPERASTQKRAPETIHLPSAHVDTFAQEYLAPKEFWPVMLTRGMAELEYPAQLNAAAELLDGNVEEGFASRPCLTCDSFTWSYEELLECSNRLANLLVSHGLVPGERVLLRDANTPMLAACWFAVLKAGGIVVTTMPQLRAHELSAIANKARIRYALCAREHAAELKQAQQSASVLEHVIHYDNASGSEVPPLLSGCSADFDNVATSQEDIALIAFS